MDFVCIQATQKIDLLFGVNTAELFLLDAMTRGI